MSNQVVCDDCGNVIDTTQPYFVVTGVKQQMVDGVPTVVEAAVTVDFHVDHLPWELPAAPTPQQPIAAQPEQEQPPAGEEPAPVRAEG
jgi:hypothetical protein